VSCEKQVRTGLTGDEAVAYAAFHADVDVIAAYPITPQTVMVERLSEFVHNGELDAEFVPVESEHSALSASVGASLAGARVFTATASQGLALMYEILYIASALRTPIVMGLANRAFSAPINIHCSHDDAYAARDAGWIQFFAETVQEAYDLVIAGFKIAEDKNVLFPLIVNLDAFILSHSIEPLYIYEGKEVVREFLPPREPVNPIDPDNPMTYGPLALQNYYMEIKKQQYEAFKSINPHIKKVLEEYSEFSGRRYDFIKKYHVDDADIIFVILGSAAGTVREAVNRLRKEGVKVGVLSLTLYRPFPANEVREVLRNANTVIVMDRSCSIGSPGAQLYLDVATTLYSLPDRPRLVNIIYGLGGRDMFPDDIKKVLEVIKDPKVTEYWLGVRG